MKTAIGTLRLTGTETAPLSVAKAKDSSNGQFTSSFMEMLSTGGTQQAEVESKAASTGTERKTKSAADFMIASEPESRAEAYTKTMAAPDEDGVAASKEQKDSVQFTELAPSDRIATPAAPMPCELRSEVGGDSSSPISEEAVGDIASQSSNGMAPQKAEKQSASFEKSGVKSRKSTDVAKAVKKESDKEQQVDAQNVVLMGQVNSAPDRVQAGCVVPSAPESSVPNQSKVEVKLAENSPQKPAKQVLATTSSVSMNGKVAKESRKGAPAFKVAQGSSQFLTGKEPVEAGQLSRPSKTAAVENKDSANTGSPGIAVSHRLEQIAVTSSGTTQPEITSTLSHRGSDAGDSIAEKRSSVVSPAIGTTPNDQPQILKATTDTLEVGLAGGPHGWVKVRAEMTSDGNVNASLSSGSVAGQQMLRHELPSLSTFLRAENVQVGSLTVQASTSADERSSLQQGGGQSADQGYQPYGGDQGREQGGGNVPELPTKSLGQASSETDMAGDGLGSDWVYSTGGSWLNVMA